LKYQYENLETLSYVPKWQEAQLQYMVEQLPCRIFIESEDPDGLCGVDIDKMQSANMARTKVTKPYRDAIDNLHQWTIAAIPSREWAHKVFPDEDIDTAYEKLWEEIFKTVHISHDNDPIKEWELHGENLIRKSQKLNSFNFDYLHYQCDNGTDFTCKLIPNSKWAGGGDYLADGTFFNPNMPTEEIFISPMKGKCEGTLVATMPLSYMGNLIENFSITFKDGKAVSCKAEKNEELLIKMLQMDEGASMLGELALVPYDSPISNSGILFYNTLFDENAACHVAMGHGFDSTIEGFEKLSKDEIKAMGVNDSLIHVDFMIGCEKLNITGYTADNEAVEIFKNGNWAF
ncbi:MAG: aminopeptidase, partial [Oscillospiraceae bacterium]